MNKHLKRTRILLVLILLLPALFLSVYEISSLNSYEETIQDIYKRQLDAILYSVNQFSVDLTDSWADKIESAVSSDDTGGIEDILSEAPAINSVSISDSTGNILAQYGDQSDRSAGISTAGVRSVLASNSDKIVRLFSYRKAGYRKVEYLEQNAIPNSAILAFAALNKKQQPVICVLIIDPIVFIRRNLAPRIQEITQRKFIISIIDNNTSSVIYQTERRNGRNFEQLKALWLLKNYSMEIRLKGATLDQVLRNRSQYNLLFIILINIILVLGFWFIFRTIRKELELAQIKSDFVSNVSHELRTPLALINMYAETLEMGRVRNEEKKNEYYKIISQETNRLSRIVNKILNFSKMEAGKFTFNFSSVDLNELVEQIYSTYSFHMKSSGFTCSLNTDESIPFIHADREAVAEAFINLLDNAVKYSTAEKHVDVSTGSQDDMVFLEVKDRGIGMDKHESEKIFDKFYRVSTGLVHNTKGTGLGLTLVKHIVDAHKGSITVSSKPGDGSCFRLYFPKE